MFPRSVRIVLVLLCLSQGIYRLYVADRTGVLFFAIAVLLIYGYFRYAAVWLAYRFVRSGNLELAKRLLAEIKYPAALAPQSRAYFEFLTGYIALNDGQIEDAERHLAISLNYAFRTDNDRCLAEVTLAQLYANSGRASEARELISQAKSRDCRPEVRQQIEQVSGMVS